MPDITFRCSCNCLFGRYVREGERIEAKCKLCGALVKGGLHTFNDGQVDRIEGIYTHRATAPRSPGHLRLPGDQYDYLSPIDGSHISSKRKHRDHLKRHGVIELGNEKPDLSKPLIPQIPREAIRTEIKNQVERMKSHGSWRER
jgi:hypothetical protein